MVRDHDCLYDGRDGHTRQSCADHAVRGGLHLLPEWLCSLVRYHRRWHSHVMRDRYKEEEVLQKTLNITKISS